MKLNTYLHPLLELKMHAVRPPFPPNIFGAQFLIKDWDSTFLSTPFELDFNFKCLHLLHNIPTISISPALTTYGHGRVTAVFILLPRRRTHSILLCNIPII